jgi:UDPglucose 6-dehydrogenase
VKITVVGTGYVGLTSAVLLAQHNEVVALDINVERVAMINRGESTVEDVELENFLKEKS